jgi:hypothetical protein
VTIDLQRIRLVCLTALALYLMGCGDGRVTGPNREEALTPGESVQGSLGCAEPYVMPDASPDEYAWAMEALENIDPGVTHLDEVSRLFGEATSYYGRTLIYDPDVGGPMHVTYNVSHIVDNIRLFYPMTLGQFIETYGEPSRVYRSTELNRERFPGGGPFGMTYLFYDDAHMAAAIAQGICEFPPGVPIESIILPTVPLDELLSGGAVEVAWPGLGPAQEIQVTCSPPHNVALGPLLEEYAWSMTVLENIEPGVIELEEVALLLGEPTEEDRDVGYRGWGYDPGAGRSSLFVGFNQDDIVEDVLLFYPMTLGQLIETYGEPSRVYRGMDVAAAYEDPDGPLMLTYLFYDEYRMSVYFFQELCEFPPGLVIDNIDVSTALPDRFLSFNAVEIEWPGLTTEESD